MFVVLPIATRRNACQDSPSRNYRYDSLGNRLSATNHFLATEPAFYFFAPQAILPDERINIYGRHFPFTSPESVRVSVAGKPLKVLFVAPHVITAVVPAGFPEGTVSVALGGKKAVSLGELRIIEADADGDCLPLAYEVALGLDPARSDTDGDGVLDGDEDADGDGLSNCVEFELGLHLTRMDSDADGLPDAEEIARGTDPLGADSDGDGFLDGEEVESGSDPLDPESIPPEVQQPPEFEALAATFSLLNAADPRDILETQDPVFEAVTATFSLLNAADPRVILETQDPVFEAITATFSLLNAADPRDILQTQKPVLEAVSATFSILNAAPPQGTDLLGPAFSVKNEAKP